ncbi:MAG: alpha-L-fucosidase, partial [Planctomycetota bacterium]
MLVAERNCKTGRPGPDCVILADKRTANAGVRQPRARTARVTFGPAVKKVEVPGRAQPGSVSGRTASVKLKAGGGALLKVDCPREPSFWAKGENAAMSAMNQRLMSALIVGLVCFFGIEAGAGEAKLTHEQLVEMGLKASEKDMAWWRDAKFGIFIHWGVGIEKRHASWANRTDDVYWENLFKNLAKVDKFDATEWIKVVQESGAKYVIFVTRQNGAMHRRPTGNFCLWDTQTTDNKITHPKSPFKRDVCKEIADAAHKADIKLFWYVCGGAGKNVD